MIHENGSLQVIDFGVAGVLATKDSKRNTLVGTGHWMSPELHPRKGQQNPYGKEVSNPLGFW